MAYTGSPSYPSNAPAGSPQANAAMPGYGPQLQSGFSYAAGLADAVRNAASFFGNIFSFGTLGGSSPSTSSSPTAAPTATTSPTSTTTPGATTPREAATARTPPTPTTYQPVGGAGVAPKPTTTAAPAPITDTVAPSTVAPGEKPGASAMSAMGYAAGLGAEPAAPTGAPAVGTPGYYAAPVTGQFEGGPKSGYAADRPGDRLHAGGDFQADNGSKAVSATGGQVTRVGYDPGGYDHYAVVMGDDGNAYRYAPHAGVDVKVGDRVEVGDPIGTIGLGHLHFEVIPPTSPAWSGLKAGEKASTSLYPGAAPKTLDPAQFFGVTPHTPITAGQPFAGPTTYPGLPATAGGFTRDASGNPVPPANVVPRDLSPGSAPAYTTLTTGAPELGVAPLPPVIAAGGIGNIQQESSFKADASNAGHMGYGQWDATRWANAQAWAKTNNLDINDPRTQTLFYSHELQSDPRTWNALQGAKTPAEAARIIDQYFERSGGAQAGKRAAYAESAAKAYGGGGVAEAMAAPTAAKPAAAAATGKQPSLKIGSSGPAVRDLQQQLLNAGYNPGPLDGKFGQDTRDALFKFQQANPGTGTRFGYSDTIAGPKTRAALTKATAGGAVGREGQPVPTPRERPIFDAPGGQPGGEGYAAGLGVENPSGTIFPPSEPPRTPAEPPRQDPVEIHPTITQGTGGGDPIVAAPMPTLNEAGGTITPPDVVPQELHPTITQGTGAGVPRFDAPMPTLTADGKAAAGYYAGLQSSEEDRASRARIPETVAATYAAITGGGGTDQFAGGPTGGIPATPQLRGPGSSADPNARFWNNPEAPGSFRSQTANEQAARDARYKKDSAEAGLDWISALYGGPDNGGQRGKVWGGGEGFPQPPERSMPNLLTPTDPMSVMRQDGYTPPAPAAGLPAIPAEMTPDQVRAMQAQRQRDWSLQQSDEDRATRSGAGPAAAGAAALTAPEPDVVRTLASLPPEGQAQYRTGFVNNIIDSIDQAGDARGILKAIDASPQASRRLEVVLGPQGASQFKSLVRVDGIGNREPGTRFAAALPSMAGLRGSPPVDSQVATRVGQMLDSEDPAEFSRGLKIVAANPNLQALVQRVDAMV